MSGAWSLPSHNKPAGRLRNHQGTSPTTTIAMEDIEGALGPVVSNLSDQNYAESLAFYRLWSDIGQTHHQIPPDLIPDTIRKNRGSDSIVSREGKLVHSTAHLIVRLASDVESDHLLAPHTSGLQSLLSTRTLAEFFKNNLKIVGGSGGYSGDFCADANFIAHWANLGYVEEVVIRNHILQSLISHPKLYDHQADALIILFKLAGATFEAYADPSVVDRCFELLKGHSYNPPYDPNETRYRWNCSGYIPGASSESDNNNHLQAKRRLVEVRVSLAGTERRPPG